MIEKSQNTLVLQPESQYRNGYDPEFLTTGSLIDFLSEKFVESYRHQFPISKLHHYASKDVNTYSPGIAYRLSRRVPGHGHIDKFKGSLKSVYIDSRTGDINHLWTQYQSLSYEFIVYGLDYKTVDDLTECFETFLYMLQPELQDRNVQHFLFEEELREDLAPLSTKVEDQYKRVLRYSATIQKPYLLTHTVLTKTSLKLGIESELKKDIPVFRSEMNYDYIEVPIDWTIKNLNSVSSQPFQDIVTYSGEINVATGSIAAKQYMFENIYIPEVDYKLQRVYVDNTYKYVIVWSVLEGSKRPTIGNVYYISMYLPKDTPTSNVDISRP
jgi:hypothetical protein